tara:strand:- start:29 stop:520 length:492 start_codon:yes stop_codon:yes gene_type:complete
MSTTQIITLNQLIKLFNDFSDDHFQLNDFGYGDTSEIGTSRKMEFPYLWITHRTPSRINVTNKTAIPQFTLTVVVADQLSDIENVGDDNGSASNNEQEILSDMFQVLQDFVTYISTSLGVYGVQLTEDAVSVEPVHDETTDKVSGWIADFTINLRHSNCILPI